MKPVSQFRKAVTAFIGGLLALPIAAWVGGDEPFSTKALVSGLVTAVLMAFSVYMTPNEPAI